MLLQGIPPSVGESSSLGEGTAFSSDANDSTTKGASRNFNNCVAYIKEIIEAQTQTTRKIKLFHSYRDLNYEVR